MTITNKCTYSPALAEKHDENFSKTGEEFKNVMDAIIENADPKIVEYLIKYRNEAMKKIGGETLVVQNHPMLQKCMKEETAKFIRQNDLLTVKQELQRQSAANDENYSQAA